MRAVVQRVRRARVTVEDRTLGHIERGLLVLVGVGTLDAEADAEYLAQKIAGLRIFDDPEGKMGTVPRLAAAHSPAAWLSNSSIFWKGCCLPSKKSAVICMWS